MSTRFGRLRELVHGRPSEEAWRELCRELDGASEEELRYCAGVVMRWPSELKEAPPSWIHALLAGRAHAGLILLDALAIHGRLWRTEGIAHLCESPQLDNLTHLSVTVCQLRDPAARRLAETRNLGALRRLDVTGNAISVRGLTALLERPGLVELRARANAVTLQQAQMLRQRAQRQDVRLVL